MDVWRENPFHPSFLFSLALHPSPHLPNRVVLRRWCIALLFGLCAAAAIGPPARAQSEPQEMLLEFSYQHVVHDMVLAFQEEGAVYLPVGALFNQLQIECRVDVEGRTVRGFFIDPDATYHIDASAGTAVVGGREMAFDTNDVLVSQRDIFVRPELLRAWFELDFTPDLRELKLSLSTPHRVPRVAAAERERQQNRINELLDGPPRPPLRFARDRKWIGGGVVDYTLTAREYAQTPNAYAYRLRGGIEVLGGDLEGGVQGQDQGLGWRARRTDLRWRYVLHNWPYLRRVRVGDVFSNGLRNVPYTGLKLSNAPMAPRERFGTHTIEEQTGPRWDVELYVDGELSAITTADEDGRYTFDLPLEYGGARIELREYGPKGGFDRKVRQINLPHTLLPPGEVEYALYAGPRRYEHGTVLQGTAAAGLSKRLTAEVGLDYIGGAVARPLPIAGLTARLGHSYVTSLHAAPGHHTRLALSAIYPSQRRFELQYTHFQRPTQRTLYNPNAFNHELQSSVHLPWRIFGRRLTTQWTSQITQTDDYLDLQAFPRASLSLGRLGIFGGRYRYWNRVRDGNVTPIRGDLTLDYLFWMPRSKVLPALLRGVSLRSRFTYDTRFEQWRTGEVSLARRLSSVARVRLTMGRNFRGGFNFGSLRLSLTFPYARAYSETRRTDARTQATQQISGSIGFDHTHDRFVFSERHWVGKSATAVRFFIDENGNGAYDPRERVIESEVYYDRPVPTRNGSDDVVRSQGLLPYAVHSIDLTNAGPENPKWSPRYTAFSFRSDPNVFKPLDVPVFVGGTVEGEVRWLHAGKQHPAKGFTVHLRSTETDFEASMPVFSDGSFYAYRIPPGTYHARVDRRQLKTYGMISEPPRRTVRVRALKDGDRVTGVDFVVMSPDNRQQYLAERQGPPARYIVHLGTFQTLDEAQRFVGTLRNTQAFLTAAERNLHGPLNIRHEADRGYIVETDSFRVRWRPARLVTHLQTDPAFADIYMIEADVLNPSTPPDYRYGVQAGTYSTRSRAEAVLARLRRKITLPFRATIAEDPIDGAYKLILNVGTSRDEALRFRTWLARRERILDTYVIALPARFLPEQGEATDE